MAEYIERKRAIVDACNSLELYPSEYATLEDALNKIPAADVAPVRHGRWEYTPETINVLSQIRCSGCGWWTLDPSVDGVYHYCPNCGAKMDGGNGNSDMA